MARYIPRAEFARAAGVSAPAITKACKTKLREACQGTRIDIDHPAAVAYLANRAHQAGSAAGSDVAAVKAPKSTKRRDVAPTPPASAAQVGPAKPTADPRDLDPTGVGAGDAFELAPDVSDEELVRLLRILRPIVARHGTRQGFDDWLDRVKTLEDIRKRRLDNDETEGRLISDEIVKTHIIGAMEGSHRRLLGDAPKTIARLLYAMANSKEPIEDAETRVRGVVSSVLKAAQASVLKAMP